MKMTKRILAGTVAVISAFGMIGCSKDDETTSSGSAIALTEEEVETVKKLADSGVLPDVTLENKEVNWFGHYELNPGEGQVASADIELFKIKYDGVIKDNVTSWDKRFDDLASLVITENSPDFFQADDMDVFPKGAIHAMWEPIDDYIDFSTDLWSDVQELADSFMFNGKHYVATIQATPNYICVYNRSTIAAEGYDDPAELFAKGEWTMDKFWEMCEDFVDTSKEKYALDGWFFYNAIQSSCGVPMVGLVDGQLVNNMNNPAIFDIETQMYEAQKKGITWPRKDHNWSIRGDTDGMGMSEGLTLFYPTGLWALTATPDQLTAWGDVEAGEVMFVPMPRNTNVDEYYVSARVNGYVLCNYAPNPEGFAAYMACKKACATDPDVIQVGRNQRKESYKWTDEMNDMYDTCTQMANEHPVFEFHQGVSGELATYFSNSICSATMMETDEGTKSWTEVVNEWNGTVDYMLKEANSYVATEAEKW